MTWQNDLASATMAASRVGFQASWTRSGADQDLIAGCDTLCRKSHSQHERRKSFRTERPFRSMLSHDAAPQRGYRPCTPGNGTDAAGRGRTRAHCWLGRADPAYSDWRWPMSFKSILVPIEHHDLMDS